MILLNQARTYAWLYSVTGNRYYLTSAWDTIHLYRKLYVDQTQTWEFKLVA